jgi:hypothetical protein
MGFFKRLLGRDDEPADPFGQASPGTKVEAEPIVSFQSTPTEATWTSVTVNGKPVPPEQAPAFTAAFEQLGNLASMGTSQVIDLRGLPGLREEVLGAMSAHADDPTALQRAVFEALGEHGVSLPSAGSAPPPEPDPIERIRKLDELRDQGLLSDAEFEAQKKKLLGEI